MRCSGHVIPTPMQSLLLEALLKPRKQMVDHAAMPIAGERVLSSLNLFLVLVTFSVLRICEAQIRHLPLVAGETQDTAVSRHQEHVCSSWQRPSWPLDESSCACRAFG